MTARLMWACRFFYYAFKGLSFVEIETQKREPGRSIELKCRWQYLGARPIFYPY